MSGKYLEELRVEGLRMVFGRCLEVLSQVRSYYFFEPKFSLDTPRLSIWSSVVSLAQLVSPSVALLAELVLFSLK